MKTYLVTGATRGLGLAIARELQELPDSRVIVAVRDVAKAEALGLTALKLDASSQADIARFVDAFDVPLTALVNNAGIQNVGAPRASVDGWEETIATNHLGAYALTMGLLPRTARVMFIGSGTQDPTARGATMFGFRGAHFLPLRELVKGGGGLSGKDLYATSKGLNTLTALGLARRHPDKTFITFDPGLMPGTGLARTHGPFQRFVWEYIMPLFGRLFPDGSSPLHSARVAAWLLQEASLTSGASYDHRRKLTRYLHPRARDPQFAEQVLTEADALLAEARSAAH